MNRRIDFNLNITVSDVHVYHHSDSTGGGDGRLDEILALLTTQGVTMSALSDAVDALQTRVSEDVQHLLDLLAEANARAEAAAANDAAQESELQTLRDTNAAATAEAEAIASRINAIDPVEDFPGVEPPA